MATVKVVDIITRAKTLLQDTTSVRWPSTELQLWLNDAYRDIVNLRPDSNTQTDTFTCQAGARQYLTNVFPNALRLIAVIRNTYSGSTLGAVRLIDRQVLDDQRRTWYGEAAADTIQHYMFDPRLPKEFLVYPPATTNAELEVAYASVPTAHTLTESQLNNAGTTETIRVDDSFSGAILDYILYRAYSKDAEYAANAQRAVGHLQAFQASLGAKGNSEAASQPGVA